MDQWECERVPLLSAELAQAGSCPSPWSLQLPQVVFSAEQTYELMRCLEDLTAGKSQQQKFQVAPVLRTTG